MMRWISVVAGLTAVWIALWGDVTPANVVGGVLAAGVSLIAVPLRPPTRKGTLRPLAALRYLLFFAKELLLANVVVAVEVVTPGNRDNEGIVALPVVPSCSPTVLMVIVNSIGLTPGTVVVEVGEEPDTLYVHVLHLDDHDEALRKLFEFERRALEAFGSEAALDEWDVLAAAMEVGT